MIRLFRWLSRRSLGFLHTLGAGVGWLGYWLSPTYRHRFDDHVRSAGIAAAAARAGGAPVVERSFPSLDHAFVVSATGDVAEYATPGRQVDPTFLAELAAFVAAVPARPDR